MNKSNSFAPTEARRLFAYLADRTPAGTKLIAGEDGGKGTVTVIRKGIVFGVTITHGYTEKLVSVETRSTREFNRLVKMFRALGNTTEPSEHGFTARMDRQQIVAAIYAL